MSEGFALTAEAYNELTKLVDRNTRAAEHLETQTKRLVRIIDGDGDMGLLIRVDRLGQSVLRLEQWQQSQRVQTDVEQLVRTVERIGREVQDLKDREALAATERRATRAALRTWGLSLLTMLIVALTGFVWANWNVRADLAQVQRILQNLPTPQPR